MFFHLHITQLRANSSIVSRSTLFSPNSCLSHLVLGSGLLDHAVLHRARALQLERGTHDQVVEPLDSRAQSERLLLVVKDGRVPVAIADVPHHRTLQPRRVHRALSAHHRVIEPRKEHRHVGDEHIIVRVGELGRPERHLEHLLQPLTSC